MTLPDPYPVQPLVGTLSGKVSVPGSKSITNRALVLAALSPGKVHLEGALFSRDSRLMIEALETLGYSIHASEAEERIEIQGSSGEIPVKSATLQVGNSGTTARFLAAMLCLEAGGTYRLEGDEEMERRPMQGLIQSLTRGGWAEVQYHREEGFIPFTLKTRGISGGRLEVDPSESSQMLSALLLAATRADQEVTLTTGGRSFRQSYVVLTLKIIEAFGGRASETSEKGIYKVTPGLKVTPPFSFPVEPDASSASYFFATPLVVPGELEIRGIPRLPGLQGDFAFLDFLKSCGLRVDPTAEGIRIQGEGSITHAASGNFYEISDTFLTYAALSPCFPGPVTLRGLAHTRKQETDRVAGMARELRKLGVEVEEYEDSLALTPNLQALIHLAQKRRPIIIETYKDHRFAMSFAILGLFDLFKDGEPWLAIEDPLCCSKTFPRFFQTLESLRT